MIVNLVAVDIGNSSTKVSLAANGPLIKFGSQSQSQSDALTDVLPMESLTDPTHWMIVSVNPAKTAEMVDWITRHRRGDKVFVIDNDQIPLQSAVKNRSSLGSDRLMAAFAATRLNKKTPSNSGLRPCVVVDAGTAVTIDLVDVVDDAYVFQGGLIFPGVTTSLKALSKDTAALPNLSDSSEKQDCESAGNIQIGDDTSSAILNGVVQSQTWAILGIVSQLAAQHQATVYCTGGGLLTMQSIIPKTWHLVPDLIHQGIRLLPDISETPPSENP